MSATWQLPVQTWNAQTADKCKKNLMHHHGNTKIKKKIECFHSVCLPLAIQPGSQETRTAPRLMNKSALLRFSWRKYKKDAAWGVTTKRKVLFMSSSQDEGVPFAPTKWCCSGDANLNSIMTFMSGAQGRYVWGLRLVCSACPSKQCHLEGKCRAHIIQSIIPPFIPVPVIIYLVNLIPQVSCEKTTSRTF